MKRDQYRRRLIGERDTHVRYWPTPRAFAALNREAPEHPLYRNPDGTLREWDRTHGRPA